MTATSNSLRTLVRILSLVAAMTAAATMLAFGGPAQAADNPLPPCNGTLLPTKEVPADGELSFCVVIDRSIGHLEAGQAVTIGANLKVDDSASTVNKAQRAFLNAEINCYLDGATPTKVFGTNAVRNIYTGMTSSGVYPRSVLLAKTSGDYRCILDARQYDVSEIAAPRTWKIASSSLSAAPAAFGASTRGPNLDGWPATINNVTSASESAGTGVSVAQLDAYPAAGTSSVAITASVPLTTCAYNRPDKNACWPAGASDPVLSRTTPFTATVRVYAAQRTSPTDASFCGPRLIADYPVRVDELTHHYTATTNETLALSAACTGRVTIKTELHDVTGRGYLGTPGPDRYTPGKSYQNSIGVTWN
jgi:hypothetical protein